MIVHALLIGAAVSAVSLTVAEALGAAIRTAFRFLTRKEHTPMSTNPAVRHAAKGDL